ncbi:MAG: phosphopentomutase [Candidatus Eisenbacteria bacterium]|nr:phosphopentomutase [Candidatus Eisenbacteria bacterium]
MTTFDGVRRRRRRGEGVRVFLVVLDGVGIGEMPDAADYGDAGSNTLRHVAESVGGLRVPTLESLGLGALVPVPGVKAVRDPRGARGRLAEKSAGKDSTTGHWEMMGIVLDRAFPTYPQGFPLDLLDRFCERVERGWLGNCTASGTEIIGRLGEEHQKTGRLIVYTSADSVFQIAAHEATVPLEELYAACRTARQMLTGPHAVGRVIARPFTGVPGDYKRTSNRRDFSLEPFEPTLLDRLSDAGHRTVTVGKVDDLFAGRGVRDAIHTKTNDEGAEVLLDLASRRGEGLVFANLVDFDSLYGHRNDPAGFARALETFDEQLARLLTMLREDEMIWVTADHGNDPTTASTDHSREYTPLLVAGPRVRNGRDLGTRSTFADLGATLAEMFSVPAPRQGRSFLGEV